MTELAGVVNADQCSSPVSAARDRRKYAARNATTPSSNVRPNRICPISTPT
jgi:hypothetical protein